MLCVDAIYHHGNYSTIWSIIGGTSSHKSSQDSMILRHVQQTMTHHTYHVSLPSFSSHTTSLIRKHIGIGWSKGSYVCVWVGGVGAGFSGCLHNRRAVESDGTGGDGGERKTKRKTGRFLNFEWKLVTSSLFLCESDLTSGWVLQILWWWLNVAAITLAGSQLLKSCANCYNNQCMLW